MGKFPRESRYVNCSSHSLVRSGHTFTVVGNKAYLFGGSTATNTVASNEIHAITLEHSGKPEMDYSVIPALATLEGGKTPDPRTKHAACTFHENIAIYGGCDEKGSLIDDESSVWLFNPERKAWDNLAPSNTDSLPGPRQNAKLFAEEKRLILFGGVDTSGSHASDLWQFDIASRTWSQLPTAPVATSNATLANGQLWLISSSDPVSSQLHHLSISESTEEGTWDSFTFPTNPMAPGPRARHDGALLPVTTGWGRNYLIYLLGARDSPASPAAPDNQAQSKEITQWSDTWVVQIPSSDLGAKPSLSLKEAIKPAKIKDAIRSVIGADTGHLKWAEAVVQVPSDKVLEEAEGKAHPGPRALFGADVMKNGHSVVFWGGVDSKGETVGDGWIVKFE